MLKLSNMSESVKLLAKFWDPLEHRDKTWSLNKQTTATTTTNPWGEKRILFPELPHCIILNV